MSKKIGCPTGTKLVKGRCVKLPKGLQKHILVRDDRIIIQRKDIRKIEDKYGMERMTYFENDRPYYVRDEFFINETHGNSTPHVLLRQGNNEGYIVEVETYNQKSYDKEGTLVAKFLGSKNNAMKFAKDLWSIND